MVLESLTIPLTGQITSVTKVVKNDVLVQVQNAF